MPMFSTPMPVEIFAIPVENLRLPASRQANPIEENQHK